MLKLEAILAKQLNQLCKTPQIKAQKALLRQSFHHSAVLHKHIKVLTLWTLADCAASAALAAAAVL